MSKINDNDANIHRMEMAAADFTDDASSQPSCGSSGDVHLERGVGYHSNNAIAGRESRLVNGSKLLILLLLGASATLLGYGTFRFLSQQIENRFERKFEDHASEVIQVSQINAQTLYDAYDDFGRTITSYAIGSNSTWPFVTIPYYDEMALHIQQLFQANNIAFGPLVEPSQRSQWEGYAIRNQNWIVETFQRKGLPPPEPLSPQLPFLFFPSIYRLNITETGRQIPYADNVPPNPVYAPVWQVSPTTRFYSYTNFNGFAGPVFRYIYPDLIKQRRTLAAKALDLSGNLVNPSTVITHPVFDSFDHATSKIVAILSTRIPWHVFFQNIVPEGANGIMLVISNCDQIFTFAINGPALEYLSPSDVHDTRYDYLEMAATNTTWHTIQGCPYSLRLYPSDEFHKEFESSGPLFYAIAVGLVFLITAISFGFHDGLVGRSQQIFVTKAMENNAIVDGFVPADVRDRLLIEDPGVLRKPAASLNNGEASTGKPIADLHPHCTIMIADIANFTTWSSAREPAQVIAFLEALYAAFDKLAKLRGVFKVETIGDSYVAATGLPQPRDDHAVVMARFAYACVRELKKLVVKLETYLGPDTSCIGMRFGLHSGPVTAGVLRGKNMRFQVFGPTVNMANAVQSSGKQNMVHLSQATATLLSSSDKKNWVKQRDDVVNFKGHGELPTFWLQLEAMSKSRSTKFATLKEGTARIASSEVFNSSPSNEFHEPQSRSPPNDTTKRLVSWNVDVLSRLLKQIVAIREAYSMVEDVYHEKSQPQLKIESLYDTVLEEVKEVIKLPSDSARYKQDPALVDLGPTVTKQLDLFVEKIASMYRDNHFHSFQHACHVSQSLSKLLSRIVTPDSVDYVNMTYKRKGQAIELHEFTYGIASDPITQFACAFSALIHDLDHRGIPNTQLIKEEIEMASKYKNKSVAEQNSVDLAWDLLMQPEYSDLRRVIFITQEELDRFRQLVVNSVMATDIVDKELGALRKKRWDTAFAKCINNAATTRTKNSDNNDISTDPNDGNRKATIVIEHLIQAADVAHTMQHWNVYLKWNERFFKEMYQAYLDGRADKDPSIGWYEGEIGFFDFYIIPLAKKLESCGVFGVSSDECLSYAVANRHEWSVKGKDIVKRYLDAFERKN